MYRILLGLLSLMFGIVIAQEQKPKLVVGIVVDQMRAEYLSRFYHDFEEGGFKRMMKEGFQFKNTHFNYMPTYTAPGHSSVYTGTTPAIHGIVGNSWFHKQEGKKVYCTSDERYASVGMDANDKAGHMSPWRLQSTTITDEVKMATQNRGKVIGISVKDRGAILPAGHFADAAYWMNDDGHFITSTYYMQQLPQWVKKYNAQENAQKYVKKGWSLLKSKDVYNESLSDNNAFERVFKGEKAPTLPRDLQAISDAGEGVEIVKTSPFGNNMVAELATLALENEQLGTDEYTDFLAVSFSSTDYVGHSYGPRSMEIQDTYLRLDRTLADFFKTLDKKVGKGNYLVFLTSDHAAAENPQHLNSMGYEVKSLHGKELKKELDNLVNEYVKQKGGIVSDGKYFLEYYNQNIFLNEALIAQNTELDYNELVGKIQQYLSQKPFVSKVFSRAEILKGNSFDPHLQMIAKGYDPKQNGDLVVLLKPQYMEYFETGTTHGSTYAYDTHAPNLWMGWGIPKGESVDKKYITQIAPTVSMLLNITFPNGSQNLVLQELWEKE